MSIEGRYQSLRKAYDAIEVGHRVRLLRTAWELTQSGLARHLNVKPNTISQIESGVSRPAPDLEIRLKAAFGITIDWIRFGEMAGLSPETIRRIDESKAAIGSVPEPSKPKDRLPPKKPRTLASPIRRSKSK